MAESPTVRAASPADARVLADLFTRAGQGSPGGELWHHAPSEMDIYLTPYLDHPQATVLLAEANGVALGYLAGCYDTAAFPLERERIEQAIRDHQLMSKPRPVRFFLRAGFDTVAAKLRRHRLAGDFADTRWPAHLHIDVVPEARGHGAGPRLIERWLALLDRRGVGGCFLQTQVENERARRFFTRYGFVAHGEALPIAGARWHGRRIHQLTMVR